MNELKQLQFGSELSDIQCTEFFGISKRTWKRWKRTSVHKHIIELLKCKCGSMEIFGSNWKNWSIHENKIYMDGLYNPVTQGINQ